MWRGLALLGLMAATDLSASDGYLVLRGHGGPIMGLNASADGRLLLTASFDYSVGVWALDSARPRWLEGHDAAVNTVTLAGQGRAASGGDDFSVILWDLVSGGIVHRLQGHQGKVVAVRPSPDGTMLASASWDGTVRLWSLADGQMLNVLRQQAGGFNDVAWVDGGATLLTAGTDGTLAEWDVAEGAVRRVIARHSFGVNRIVVDQDRGWIAYGAVDGGTRVLDLRSGEVLADLTLDRRPILALAQSPDGARLAVGDGEGWIMIVDTANWTIERDFHAAANGPIWALAFAADGKGVFSGGIDDEVSLWPLDGSDSQPRMAEIKRGFHVDPEAVGNGERQFLRKCSICHTLGESGERRAGPALAGLFGRKAGSLPGYSYSEALQNSGIVWDEATIDRLFELGPAHYTPGSKMPMQQISAPQDRLDLIAFLRRETAASKGKN